ncbi:helix-turn-helix domain-containing protein [Labedaea rhizosphaerae]|uniref:Excisionase family DNA binding protein n=1 Tax=Labedaea rhizosphaerae TaxID=598644 RepID=A0A4R6SH69_LABRH|nr:helix-turn-helix domain-containing protein [Labedaea rhizosphaerae]TDQ00696.1 excisionase family DNA binding protein [Labedaea rhizosphaerae]
MTENAVTGFSNSPDGNAELADCLRALTNVLRAWLDRVPQDPDALLTPDDMALVLKLPARTIKDQAAAGVFQHHRFGKHYRFSRADIAAIQQRAECSEQPVRRPRIR